MAKKILTGVLVMTLAFGMMVIGCDNGSGSGSGGGKVEEHVHTYGSWSYVITTAQGTQLWKRTCSGCGFVETQYR